jgi:chaperonin GroEL
VGNSGNSADVVLNELARAKKKSKKPENIGWNAAEDRVCDMLEMGIVDPVKVSRSALENAVSVATTFLTLDAVVCES